MSWYDNLSKREIRKTHVRVTYKNGDTVNCRMNDCGDADNPSYLFSPEILRRTEHDLFWEIADTEIESVDFVWNEDDMEPIDISEMSVDDYIVLCNGRLEHVSSYDQHYVITDSGISVHKDYIETVLRKKILLPSGIGPYISDKGDLVIHYKDNWWNVYDPDCAFCRNYVTEDLPTKYRNLTPAEFKRKD